MFGWLFSGRKVSPSPASAGSDTPRIFDEASGIPASLLPLLSKIEEEYHRNPPTIAVIGLSGVGKSTTINAMFNTNLTVSATTRGTTKFEAIRAKLDIQRSDAKGNSAYLQVFDAPGLGEDEKLDPSYLDMYEEHLPKCDVALWVIAARNRALALDQQYIRRLKPHIKKIVFGISQVDLVDPLDWNTGKNLPSSIQSEHIDRIVKDRADKLSEAFGSKVSCVAYSSAKYYRLMELYQSIIDNTPEKRRWLFDLVRAFDARDWLAQASGLTDDEKARIVERFEQQNPVR
jgi:small GTP-binding protein